jgi:heme/copper-type cytochrome/quinol oxidase subunit 2
MWGNITLDFIYQNNYHFGFPTTRTDNLLRITQWQYWWWFWFTYFLVLYYFLVMRLFRFRLLKFRPKIATTIRPHGKWGDLVVCLLPISWCANILSNSNLILRMLEWQAESSLFTVRVRGKQWYWVYKFELKTITDILSAPKSIGHNKWLISTFNDLKLADDYLHIIQLRSQNKWLQQYWTEIFDRNWRNSDFYVSAPQELLFNELLASKAEGHPDMPRRPSTAAQKALEAKKQRDLKNSHQWTVEEWLNQREGAPTLTHSEARRKREAYIGRTIARYQAYSVSKTITARGRESFALFMKNITSQALDEYTALQENPATARPAKTPQQKNLMEYLKTRTPVLSAAREASYVAIFDAWASKHIADPVTGVINVVAPARVLAADGLSESIVWTKQPIWLPLSYADLPSNRAADGVPKASIGSRMMITTWETHIPWCLSVLLPTHYDMPAPAPEVVAPCAPVPAPAADTITLAEYVFNMGPEASLYRSRYSRSKATSAQKLTYDAIVSAPEVVASCAPVPAPAADPITLAEYVFNMGPEASLSRSRYSLSEATSAQKLTYNAIFQKEVQKKQPLGRKLTVYNFNHSDFLEVNRWLKKSNGANLPARLIKMPLKYTDFNQLTQSEGSDFKLLRFKFNDNVELIQHKTLPHNNYLTLKQKRYQRKKIVPQKISVRYPTNYFMNLNTTFTDTNTLEVANALTSQLNSRFAGSNLYMSALIQKLLAWKKVQLLPKYSGADNKKQSATTNPYLYGNKIIFENFGNASKQYRLFKKNKVTSENVPITLARRLLRTKRTLVLPAHVNITVITNSYDVIHSWFIPGLGLKLDCIPGRATHHTLHIDNAGFYYGQCAEICGRYHHHMPIRICALPFEHFLIWWHTFGLPKLLHTNSNKKYENLYAFKKYVW